MAVIGGPFDEANTRDMRGVTTVANPDHLVVMDGGRPRGREYELAREQQALGLRPGSVSTGHRVNAAVPCL